MKLKFEKEVQDVVDAIALLPDTATETFDAVWKPNGIIGELDRTLVRQRDEKTLALKRWTKLRRQLSFLYEIVLMSVHAGKKISEIDNEASKQESYRFLVKVIKKIKAGTALDHPTFVRLGLGYGVVHLSDHEIQQLIDNNKV